MLVHKEHPKFNITSSYEKEAFCSEDRFIIIADNYVSNMALYLLFNDCGFTEVIANIQC